MRKTKDFGFHNGIYKNEQFTQDEQIINLKLELPEKLITEFKGEQNEPAIKEIEHVLKDDDTDLLYYDKELNLLDNNLTPSILKLSVPKLNSIPSDHAKPKIRLQSAKKK